MVAQKSPKSLKNTSENLSGEAESISLVVNLHFQFLYSKF